MGFRISRNLVNLFGLIFLGIFMIVVSQAKADAKASSGVFDVYNYGAAGDGIALDTKAIQAAVDACSQAGGGKVYLHNGTFRSGTIFLKSNTMLYIEIGTVLLASDDMSDYPVTIPEFHSRVDAYTNKSLIYAEKQENISIQGLGVIEGQKVSLQPDGKTIKVFKDRPFTMRIVDCKYVTVKDITFRKMNSWVQHYLGCEYLTIDGVTVHSKIDDHVAPNNDGLNIDSCNKVRVSNCEINSGDDAIVLKSTSFRPCTNVTITNCVLSSFCYALKLGTESNIGFENITVTNCTIYDSSGAIGIMTVDGAKIDRVNVSNITMTDVGTALFVRLGNRGTPIVSGMEKPEIGTMKNVIISNIQASNVGVPQYWSGGVGGGCSITGLPGHPIENLTLENINIEFVGGGHRTQTIRHIPEQENAYPDYHMFGILPAYGFYVRHAANIKFHNVDLEYQNEDRRPPMFFEDVKDIDISGFHAQSASLTQALIWLDKVDGAMIHDCRLRNWTRRFLRVDESSNISLMNNDLRKAEQVWEKGVNVPDDAVKLVNNLADFDAANPKIQLCKGYYLTEDLAKTQLDEFAKSYHDVAEWEARAKNLREGILCGAELWPLPTKTPLNPIIRDKREYAGYTVGNVAFESLPGVFVTGSFYRPRSGQGPFPAVLCTHGHWWTLPDQYGRYQASKQTLCANLARMGAVVFAPDMVGWGNWVIDGTEKIPPDEKNCLRITFPKSNTTILLDGPQTIRDHVRNPKVLKQQLWNNMRALDFLISLGNVAPQRIGVTGASGGGLQTFLLAAVDERVAVSIPVCMVSAEYTSDCICDYGMPIHLSQMHQTNSAEIAALAAPRAQLVISNGQDWTKHVPEIEFPYIQNVYRLYGKQDNVENLHLVNEGHDYKISKRLGAYRFFAKHLNLSLDKALNPDGSEREAVIEKIENMLVFTPNHPKPNRAISDSKEIDELFKRLQK